MKLVCGVDLSAECPGPLRFSRWLMSQSEGHSLTAVHVLEASQRKLLAAGRPGEDILDLARQALRDAVRRAELGEADTEVVADDRTPAVAIAEVATENGADALVIGRLARRSQDRLVRLGGVARRLLRSLPTPTIVVPPDWAQANVGAGPIIVAVDGSDHSLGAYHAGIRLGQQTGREVVLAHVVPMPRGWSVGYLPPRAVEQIRTEFRASGGRLVERWMSDHGFPALRTTIVDGAVPDELDRLADAEDALCVVVGSRRLTPAARLFSNSSGSELCARATRPTVVAAPDVNYG